MTRRQRQLLCFIEAYQARNGGVSPSYAEMAAALGVCTIAQVIPKLDRLAEDGFIRRIPNRARAIEVVRPVPAASLWRDGRFVAALHPVRLAAVPA